jgi:hypothetical protein
LRDEIGVTVIRGNVGLRVVAFGAPLSNQKVAAAQA